MPMLPYVWKQLAIYLDAQLKTVRKSSKNHKDKVRHLEGILKKPDAYLQNRYKVTREAMLQDLEALRETARRTSTKYSILLDVHLYLHNKGHVSVRTINAISRKYPHNEGATAALFTKMKALGLAE